MNTDRNRYLRTASPFPTLVEVIQNYANQHSEYVDYCVSIFSQKWEKPILPDETIGDYLRRVYEYARLTKKLRMRFICMLTYQVVKYKMKTSATGSVVGYIDYIF